MNIQGITPNIAAPMQAQSTSTPRAATSTSSGTNTGALGGTNLQATFLNLLVTELQNQDPTSPVDPTQMVGQMVSLNQLNQLIAMNQTLTAMANGTTSPASTSSSKAYAQIASASGSNGSGSTSNPPVAGASTDNQAQPAYTLPIDPNAMMNLYGSAGATGIGSNPGFALTGGK